jgi:DNA (cytosine-5)-methyltransferase 1
MKGLSLFTGAGISETYLKNTPVEIVVANELLHNRAKLYSHFYPSSNMICGDITNPAIYSYTYWKECYL